MRIEEKPDILDPRWMFYGRGRTEKHLVLSERERKTLRQASKIAARMRVALALPDTEIDYELARLEHAADEVACLESILAEGDV